MPFQFDLDFEDFDFTYPLYVELRGISLHAVRFLGLRAEEGLSCGLYCVFLGHQDNFLNCGFWFRSVFSSLKVRSRVEMILFFFFFAESDGLLSFFFFRLSMLWLEVDYCVIQFYNVLLFDIRILLSILFDDPKRGFCSSLYWKCDTKDTPFWTWISEESVHL